ncbi:19867_t:CDS:2, partial [Dentiscutata erythropus]
DGLLLALLLVVWSNIVIELVDSEISSLISNSILDGLDPQYQASTYPTISDVCLCFGCIFQYLDKFIDDELHLEKSILDPSSKLTTFAYSEKRDKAIASLYNLMQIDEPLEELNLYLSSPPCSKDPFNWWALNRYQFPTLAKIACNYLAIQRTSVSCKESFSVAARTITKIRNHLLFETARTLLCMKS